jgi:hypothetical protein
LPDLISTSLAGPVGRVGERVAHEVADDLPQPDLVADDEKGRPGPPGAAVARQAQVQHTWPAPSF